MVITREMKMGKQIKDAILGGKEFSAVTVK